MILGFISLQTIIYFSIYSLFSFYLQLHVKEFKGESEIFRFILSIFSLLVIITGISFLVYLGFQTVWWFPLLLFSWSFIFKFFGISLEKIINKSILSLLGFVICPVLAILMFNSI